MLPAVFLFGQKFFSATQKSTLMRLLLFLLFPGFVFCQGSPLPTDHPAYPLLDRLEILQGSNDHFHASLKYYDRQDVVSFLLALDSTLAAQNAADLAYLFADNAEWLPDSITTRPSKKPFLKHFYQSPANFYEISKPDFFLKVNPLLRLSVGFDPGDEQPLFENSRGVELRGGIDQRIYFYANILESQARFPSYARQWVDKYRAVPGAGLHKTYRSTLFDLSNAYDFLNSQSYISFKLTPHVNTQFGYGRNFIGHGYRSLLLSDFASNYLYLKLNWRVWKLHYQNVFAELGHTSPAQQAGDGLVPKKYMAAHHLSINIRPNLTIGLFEAVIFERNNFFELNYLNPLILYRSIEGALGSPDNVLIGLDARWNAFGKIQWYGQLMLDEFKFDELFLERRGWWANKYAFQVGLKALNLLGIDHLDVALEYNQARPYTYTHRDSTANYAHFNQALAHPLGANFKEGIVRLRYQPSHNWLLEARFIRFHSADDSPGSNWGSNILLSYQTREQDYGNSIGQGISYKGFIAGLDLSYQVKHNLFLDLNLFYRQKDSTDDRLDLQTRYVSSGLRMNLGRQRFDF